MTQHTNAALLAVLATACGYHTGPDCEHCADALARNRAEGMTDEQLAADVELFRTNHPLWVDVVRLRIELRRTTEEQAARVWAALGVAPARAATMADRLAAALTAALGALTADPAGRYHTSGYIPRDVVDGWRALLTEAACCVSEPASDDTTMTTPTTPNHERTDPAEAACDTPTASSDVTGMTTPGTPDHPHTDPGDGRTECDRCGKWVWPVIHSCKGVPVTDRARARRQAEG